MPVLHTYRSKEGHYILAGVNGRIVTYRLSIDGAKRLLESGIAHNDKFSWQILLELIRQGEAYTSAPGADDEDLSGWTQLGLFNIQDNEPTSAEAVPLCACGSMEELHIVGLPAIKTATLLCKPCRVTKQNEIDTSIPIYLINTTASMQRLLTIAGLSPDSTLERYQNLLASKHAEKWEKIVRNKRGEIQSQLFSQAESGQGSLL